MTATDDLINVAVAAATIGIAVKTLDATMNMGKKKNKNTFFK